MRLLYACDLGRAAGEGLVRRAGRRSARIKRTVVRRCKNGVGAICGARAGATGLILKGLCRPPGKWRAVTVEQPAIFQRGCTRARMATKCPLARATGR